MLHSIPIPQGQPVIFPFYIEDKKSTSRNLFKDLSRAQTRSVKSALKSDSFPRDGVIPVYSSDQLVLLVLLGKKQGLTTRDIREIGEGAIGLAKKYRLIGLSISTGSLWKDQDLYTAFLEGLALGTYKFNNFKGTLTKESNKEDSETNIDRVGVIGREQKELDFITNTVQGVGFAKDLINTPPSVANPEYTQELIEKTFKNLKNTKVSTLKEKELKKLGAGGILAVGQASDIESRFVIVEYLGGQKKDAPLAFVGKGVTYDTGGLSIKPAQYMRGMKMDLGGAATVLGGMLASILNNAKKNIVVVIPLAENAVSQNAYKPDDVVTMINGKTIEITNTDAEGRLLLGDALWYAIDRFSPVSIVDMATLTGACEYAVGPDMTAIMTNNQSLCDTWTSMSERVDEPIWQLPLHAKYEKEMKSRVADLLNASVGFKPGTIMAGMFLQHFVEKDVPWCHLDIASVAFDEKKGMASGRNVRLMQEVIMDLYKK